MSNAAPVRRPTVRLTPSSVTEPFSAMNRESAPGASTVAPSAPASSRQSRTVATPSTCPVTRWPPSALPAAIAGSRFTALPGSSRPSVVRASVSPESSASKRPFPTATSVRQQPATATLSPTRQPVVDWLPLSMASRRPPPASTMATTVPTAVTMPVNMASMPRPQAQQQVAADVLPLHDRELQAPGEGGRRLEVRERARPAPQQCRREIQEQLVDEARGEQCARQARPALDQQLVDLPRREGGQCRIQVDAAR